MKIAGADYGSKLAGTTVIAHVENNKVHFLQSEKKKDADQFLLKSIEDLRIEFLFLDAPLSLPGVYRNLPHHDNYFYRKVDVELKAMSPMFLGGLTARAMRLKKELGKSGVEVMETYPSMLAKRFQLKDFHYKKQKEHLIACFNFLIQQLEWSYKVPTPENWHQLDALLAFYSAWRYENGVHDVFGTKEEGMVYV
ncbi:MAG: hypothetical protein AAF806_25060 [Bacteroidota bacterium]